MSTSSCLAHPLCYSAYCVAQGKTEAFGEMPVPLQWTAPGMNRGLRGTTPATNRKTTTRHFARSGGQNAVEQLHLTARDHS